jgi:hypothetical protein
MEKTERFTAALYAQRNGVPIAVDNSVYHFLKDY